jgi:hypothetical protein
VKVYAKFFPLGPVLSVFEMTAAAESAYDSGIRFPRPATGRYSSRPRSWAELCRDSADWPEKVK